MSDVADMKRRGMLTAAICMVAFAGAVGGFVIYFQSSQAWAGIAAIAALVVGFGAQIWLIASLRRATASSDVSVRAPRTNGGV